ncbi:putative Gonadotropin-releasing hormone II receptor [Hypsibius exemplaris]|uniref:Gonadotropin-releasing hormone II receptor n=1 Tax=Hypsibius exemplaris TaxID=2072580 RepID=A0A1W0X3U9_HYPEX|nr:putative Gonadotropin-releasing hormone II receptor [Hypsibius exemplaris]
MDATLFTNHNFSSVSVGGGGVGGVGAETLPYAARNSFSHANYTLADFKTLNSASILSITVYSVLLFFGFIGNLVVFLTLLKSRYRKSSRVNKLILHLAIADLIVCCFTIPIEIGWRVTVTWDAGDFFCRILQFSRPFGLYLSSNTIICISLDRYFAIVQPLRLADARRRGRLMLLAAWLVAVISSIPQLIIFRTTSGEIEELPDVIIYDCVSTGYFKNPFFEAFYNVFSICIMYVFPLLVTVIAYGLILSKISITRRLKATSQRHPADPASTLFLSHDKLSNCGTQGPLTTAGMTHNGADGGLRVACGRSASFVSTSRFRVTTASMTARQQSDLSKIERARNRTLKLTLLIVSVFIICFTPYAVLVLWYQFDRKSAQMLDQTVQESLFLFAVSNSILNPYLYGIYSKNLRKEICRSFIWRAIRDFFSKNVCGDSSFSGGLGRQWTKGNDGIQGEKGNAVHHPLGPPPRWTPPLTPVTASKMSDLNNNHSNHPHCRAPPTGPDQYFSVPKRVQSEGLASSSSRESYSAHFVGGPLQCSIYQKQQQKAHQLPPYLPQSPVSSKKSLVSEERSRSSAANVGTTNRKVALRNGTAVAGKKSASSSRTKSKSRIYDDVHSNASSFD